MEDKSTPFYDPSLSIEDRIAWLLGNLTIVEKCGLIGSSMPDIPRLGIRGVGVGGEAAHGVQQRNDWAPGLPEPEATTAFPQPIGMSASWDKERIRKAGEVTGIESRVIAHRHKGQGLSRWAPTVDLERDPRWGRNEEGYGEDPHLTGEMAGNYILGMQGDDPKYIRCASTLKHFYANNTEEGRGYKNSTIDPRNREELYLETFRHVARVGHPQGVMTAYNKINGTVGMFNPEVQKVLKDECGIVHAVSDGAAPDLARSMQHRYGTDAEVVAAALHAGIDGLVNNIETFQPAAMEALELGLITEADLDRAITNQMRTKMRLGLFDRESVNPFDNVTEADLGSEENAAVSLDLAHASLVLLRNEGILPLDVDKIKEAEKDFEDGRADRIPLALIGPLGDRWDQDWYCGEPMYKSTLKQGLEKDLGAPITFDDGLDEVCLYVNGKPVCLQEEAKPDGGKASGETADGGEMIIRLVVKEDGEAEHFVYEEYGDGCISLKSKTYGKYVVPLMAGYGTEGKGMPDTENGALVLGPKVQFDWFATGALRLENAEASGIILKDRWGRAVAEAGDGCLKALKNSETAEPLHFEMRIVSSGSDRAAALAAGAETVILALGSHPMIPAKEELDRRSMALPGQQEKLLLAAAGSNERTVLMLFANYPFVSEYFHYPKAILMSATGSQDMGQAAADALLGEYAPAGRLAQSWPAPGCELASIDDYDIIGGNRTYRYSGWMDNAVEFGFGLSYTQFSYSDFKANIDDDRIHFSVNVKNVGKCKSDEVVQIFARFPSDWERPVRARRPQRQLVAFARVHDIEPGETRSVELTGNIAELRCYDVRAGKMILESGTYSFFVPEHVSQYEDQFRGESLEAAELDLDLAGEKIADRKLLSMTYADHYDWQMGTEITDGFYDKPVVCAYSKEGQIKPEDRKAELEFRDYRLAAGETMPRAIRILLASEGESTVEVSLKAGASPFAFARGEWRGNTKAGMPGSSASADEKIQAELEAYYNSLPARFAYAQIPLTNGEAVSEETLLHLGIALNGDVKIVRFHFVK